MDCDLIIICEHEIAVGRMKELGQNKNIDFKTIRVHVEDYFFLGNY